jgi:hypothetical protein
MCSVKAASSSSSVAREEECGASSTVKVSCQVLCTADDYMAMLDVSGGADARTLLPALLHQELDLSLLKRALACGEIPWHIFFGTTAGDAAMCVHRCTSAVLKILQPSAAAQRHDLRC